MNNRIDRPIGLYVLAGVDFGLYGVLQFLAAIDEARKANGEIPFAITFITLFLCVFSAAAAVWAVTGDKYGRYALLTFITLNVAWITALLVMDIFEKGTSEFDEVKLILGAGKLIFGLSWNWWYLNSDEILRYFEQQAKLDG